MRCNYAFLEGVDRESGKDHFQGWSNMRGILINTAVLAVFLGAAPIAVADDVPGINDDAVLGAPCASTGRYIYGRGPSGEPLACVGFDGAGQWVQSMPLVGVREVGSPCVGEGDAVAQSPDGLGLVCASDQGWQPGP